LNSGNLTATFQNNKSLAAEYPVHQNTLKKYSTNIIFNNAFAIAMFNSSFFSSCHSLSSSSPIPLLSPTSHSSQIHSMHLSQVLPQVISSNKATLSRSIAARNGTSVIFGGRMNFLMTLQFVDPLVMLCAAKDITVEALAWYFIIRRIKSSKCIVLTLELLAS
jgi:hypothetical protein